jgi:hypothetical protein
MNIIKIILLSLFLSLCGISATSAGNNDFCVWNELNFFKRIHSVNLGLFSELYTKDNSNSVDRISAGLRGDYYFYPWLSAGMGFSLMNYKQPGYLELRNRFYLQVEPTWHLSNFRFFLRERVHKTFFPESRTNAQSTAYWRNRLEIWQKIHASRIEPVASIESWCRVSPTSQKRLDEFRYSLGAFYHVTDTQKIKIYGLLSNGVLLDRYILGFTYEIKL